VAGTGATLIASLLEDSFHSSNSDENGSQDVSNDNLRTVFDYSPLSVEQAIPKLKKCLSLAGKLDPQTGGSKFHMWVLSKPAGKVETSNSSSDHGLVPVTADYVSRALG
jgi:20S proteasome alpha/beta subunit